MSRPNHQSPIINHQITTNQSNSNAKPFDLEDRTFNFAKRCRDYAHKLPKTQANLSYAEQLIRASGSVAANYIEANEAVSKKDFTHRIRISRKEAKESRLWLRLSQPIDNPSLRAEQIALIQEALEFTKIFTSILTKNSPPNHH